MLQETVLTANDNGQMLLALSHVVCAAENRGLSTGGSINGSSGAGMQLPANRRMHAKQGHLGQIMKVAGASLLTRFLPAVWAQSVADDRREAHELLNGSSPHSPCLSIN